MKHSILFGTGLCLLMVSIMGQAADSSTDEDDCVNRIERQELFTDLDKKTDKTILRALESGRLFYKELPSGYCVLTYETYLIGRYPDGGLTILSVIQGHTLEARLHKLGNEQVLLLFYHAGGNAYVFEAYKFAGSHSRAHRIELIEGSSAASNMGSIDVEGDTVTINNIIDLFPPQHPYGTRAILTDVYRYRDNAFVLVKSGHSEIFEPPVEEEMGSDHPN